MGRTKLIVVEGMPGSGKTTMAAYVQRWLEGNRIQGRLFCEGDLEHPADYEAVAYFTAAEYADLLSRHPHQQDVLVQYTCGAGDDRFLGYRQVVNAQALPKALLAELAQHDVYEIADFEAHARLIRDRWRAFVATALAGEEVFVFECCVLQNPLTVALLKHNLPRPDARRHVGIILDTIRPLDPIVIYLWQRDVHASLERIAHERPQEWVDFVSDYTDRGAWAQATGMGGYQGFIDAQSARQAVELALLPDLGDSCLRIDVSNREWRAAQRHVAQFLRTALTGSAR